MNLPVNIFLYVLNIQALKPDTLIPVNLMTVVVSAYSLEIPRRSRQFFCKQLTDGIGWMFN
jgi:hypothetical protein